MFQVSRPDCCRAISLRILLPQPVEAGERGANRVGAVSAFAVLPAPGYHEMRPLHRVPCVAKVQNFGRYNALSPVILAFPSL